ncbi:MAG: hypothetical protein IT303_02840 [Dehalococcoidia bacterium]|nr:hypothetical protein [Dehalococcoidia bacterium]
MRSPTWGDTVRIKKGASPEMRPGALASVCGMREVETAEQAKQFDCEIGSTLYLIEFGDGWSTEITQNYVEAVGDEE